MGKWREAHRRRQLQPAIHSGVMPTPPPPQPTAPTPAFSKRQQQRQQPVVVLNQLLFNTPTTAYTNISQALGRTWHPECFNCAKCGKSLDDEPFTESDGLLLHKTCAAKHICTKCGLPIVGTVLKANLIEGAWHPECFTCSKCNTPVATEGGALSCFMEDGEPRCDKCRTKRICTACDKQIDGQVRALGGQDHVQGRTPAPPSRPPTYANGSPLLRTAGALQARRGKVTSFGVISTALLFLVFGGRKWVKRAQRRGAILKTDKNVAITTAHSRVRLTKGTISPVPR